MISPWKTLNSKGHILTICCVLNVIVAIILAREGDYMCVFSIIMAAFCGMATYHKRYQYLDATDINNTIKNKTNKKSD